MSVIHLLRRPKLEWGFALVISVGCQLLGAEGFQVRRQMLEPCKSQTLSLYSRYIHIFSIIGAQLPLWLKMGF